MNAPIAFFAFNRPDALQRLLDSLHVNPEYAASEKFFFIDGPRNKEEETAVNRCIEIARKEGGKVISSPTNKGLARNIIEGISEVLKNHDSVIVLEDDLVLAPGFMKFMNVGLERFKEDSRIISICGYGLKIKKPADYPYDIYLSNRSSSWGWGTWADRWNEIDWDIADWVKFSSNCKEIKSFCKAGSDMFSMLKGYMTGRNNSWAIRFCYSQWRHSLYSVHPFRSLADNRGFGEEASNCRQKYSRFKTEQDLRQAPEFNWPNPTTHLTPSPSILQQLRRYHSIPRRLYSRMRKLLNI